MMRSIFASLTAVFLAVPAYADEMKLAVTTSFHNSGLSDILLPALKEDTGIEVQLLVVGTGQALRLGEAGDVDAILVHSRAAEEAFVEAGYSTARREIMYNDFILVGPEADPAQAGQATSIRDALWAISGGAAPFVSRGDDSGTHKRELSLWEAAGMNPASADWYRATGSGMGAALNTAAGMGAYILSDRASWLNFGNKDGLMVIFEGDEALFNQYAYLKVNPELHDHVEAMTAARLEAWLVSDRAADLINGYEIDGQKLFTFNAVR